LILAISGNFTKETLGCQFQKLGTNNMYFKQFIIFLMIYFTTNFTSSENSHPFDNLQKSFLIWIGFIMFAKQSLTTSLIIFALLIIMYFNDQYIKYYSDRKKKKLLTKEDEKELKNKKRIQNYLTYGFLTVLIVGFGWYGINKKKQYNGDFNLIDFLFGTLKCDGLNQK